MDLMSASDEQLQKKLKATNYTSYLTSMAVENELLYRLVGGDLRARKILHQHIRTEFPNNQKYDHQ